VTTQHLAAQEHLDIRFMTCAAEETGLRVTSFYPDIRTKTYAPKDDDCFAFVPFCCQQQ